MLGQKETRTHVQQLPPRKPIMAIVQQPALAANESDAAMTYNLMRHMHDQ